MSSLGNVYIDLLLRDHATRGLIGVQGVMGRLQARLQGMAHFARNALLAGGVLVGGMVREFANYEKGLSKVSTLLSDDAMKWMPLFDAGIKDLSASFGESKTQLVQALYDIISATNDPAGAMDVLRHSTMAARAGFAETGVVAKAITSVMVGFGDKAGSVAHITDVMTAAVNKGRLDMTGYAERIGRLAPLAASAGMSFEDLSAAFSVLSQTMPANEASTMLFNFLTQFLNPSERAAANAKALGFEFNRSALSSENLAGTLAQLGEPRMQALLSKMFPDTREFRAALALTSAKGREFMDDFRKYIGESDGLTLENLAKRMDDFSWKMDQIKQRISNLAIVIGKVLAEAILGNLKILEPIITKLAKWAEKNKELVVTIIGVSAAVLVAAYVIGTLTPAIMGVGYALMFLASNPITLAITAVIALGAYFIWTGSKGETMAERMVYAFTWMKLTLQDFALSAQLTFLKLQYVALATATLINEAFAGITLGGMLGGGLGTAAARQNAEGRMLVEATAAAIEELEKERAGLADDAIAAAGREEPALDPLAELKKQMEAAKAAMKGGIPGLDLPNEGFSLDPKGKGVEFSGTAEMWRNMQKAVYAGAGGETDQQIAKKAADAAVETAINTAKTYEATKILGDILHETKNFQFGFLP